MSLIEGKFLEYGRENQACESIQNIDPEWNDDLKQINLNFWCSCRTASSWTTPLIQTVTEPLRQYFKTNIHLSVDKYRTRQTFRICILTATQNWLHGQTRAASWSILGCILKVERGIHRAKPKWRTDFSMIDFSACGWWIELKFWI